MTDSAATARLLSALVLALALTACAAEPEGDGERFIVFPPDSTAIDQIFSVKPGQWTHSQQAL